jgi:hypothetical protein
MRYVMLRYPAWLILFLIAGRPGAHRTAAAAELQLTVDGRARAAIVLAESPSAAARAAAELLRDRLEMISGARLPVLSAGSCRLDDDRRIVADGPDAIDTVLLVGQSRVTRELDLSVQDLGPGGICVQTASNALALCGPDELTPSDPWGTLYAVTWFLEEQLGCRYLWPGELGLVTPRRPTITIGQMQQRFTPPIRQRRIRSSGYNDRLQVGLDRLGFSKEQFEQLRREATALDTADPGWFRWHGVGGSLDLRSGHAFGRYWEKYGRAHPDWFAMQPNGSRDQSLAGDRARLCISNPDLIEQIARDKIAELAAAGGPNSVSVAPNDGGRLTFCMCPRCKQLDAPDGRPIRLQWDDASGSRIERKYFDYVSLTDRMAWFYNQIAERVTREYPEALLVADAYSVYASPPVREKLHPNIVIRFVPMTYLSDEGRGRALADWDAWSQAAAKIYFRPNVLNGGRRQGTLLAFPHKMGQDLRRLAGGGLIGTDFDSCLHHWATHGVNYYVLARLLWDPTRDVDAVIDDYCQAGFGPAAEPVREYFRRVEAATDQLAAAAAAEEARNLTVTAPYTADVVQQLRALLDRAATLAAADPLVCRRIAFLRRGLDFTDLQAQAYRYLEQEDAADRAAAHDVLDRRYRLMREIFQQSPLAVNVAQVAWGGGGYWKRLGWRWETQ